MNAYERWRAAVDLYLLAYSGRVLGDLPLPEAVVLEWHTRGLAAQAVAERLADRAAKVRRVTLTRFYTDARAHEVRARMLETLSTI